MPHDPLADDGERRLFARLPDFAARACATSSYLAARFAGIDPGSLTDRRALARIPVLRKAELMHLQAGDPPFGGIADRKAIAGLRVFQSPGPIWEVEDARADSAAATAQALEAAGARPGDVVWNTFSYHMTPGGFLIDAGARALGCAVFPGGTGNTDMQVEAAARLRPTVYCGTPDFLKAMLDRARDTGADLSSFRSALVTGGALFASLRDEYLSRGIATFQCYATAEFGVIAYETALPNGSIAPGMALNTHVIVEIVRPGTDDPVPDGEVGEVVVTGFNPAYPLIRLGTGDLSAFIPATGSGQSQRLRGWMGRADQRTKVKGMFVDPSQVAALLKSHPELARARLLVRRQGASDVMILQGEPAVGSMPDTGALAADLRRLTGLGGTVEIVGTGALPNDGKVIADERDYAS
jgi:phenylacetate-CoA ligase